jgi:hypothetical protein
MTSFCQSENRRLLLATGDDRPATSSKSLACRRARMVAVVKSGTPFSVDFQPSTKVTQAIASVVLDDLKLVGLARDPVAKEIPFKIAGRFVRNGSSASNCSYVFVGEVVRLGTQHGRVRLAIVFVGIPIEMRWLTEELAFSSVARRAIPEAASQPPLLIFHMEPVTLSQYLSAT